MDGTIQNYTLDMAADTKKDPLEIKQYDTNSRWARISLVAFKSPWIIPFGCQIHISVRKTDGTLANATCTRETESTVLAPITDQMAAVAGTHLGELYFLGNDGDIRSQTFPVVVRDAVTDLDRLASSDDFQVLKDALREVKTSTEAADIAAQYATEQGNSARDAAQRANDAADSIQVAVDAAAAAKVSETNAKTSEIAAAQTQQEVTDYVEAQKAAFAGYSKRESDSKYANALTETATGEGGVTVEDAWTAPVLGLDVAGKSEQVVTTGAQLLPQPQFNDTKNGITVKTQTDGGISITGTATAAITFTVAEILLQAGQYTLSGLSGLVVGKMYFQLVEISAQGGQFVGELAKVGHVTSATVTIDHDVWARAEIKVLSGVTADSVCYPMLNAGDTALPWEPYTGGKPSPSAEYPQAVEVGVTGAQLFDASTIKTTALNGVTFINNGDGSITVKGTATAQTSTNFVTVNLEPGQYRISGGNAEIKIIARVQDGETINYYSNNKFEVTISSNINIYMQIDSGKTVNSTVWPMLNVGDMALSWEPYKGRQTATITLTEPLRGIGEHRDRIRCRDGVWGIERWITKLTLDGSEDWVIYGNSSYISFYTQSVCLPVSMNKREGLCEQLRVMTIGGKNLNTIWLGANNKVVYTIDNQFYDDTLEDKGLANWKAHLAESPLEIITYLDAPTWEPFPSATQQALNALTTYAGTTHLTITAGGPAPTVTLDYVKDTHKALEQCYEAAKEYTDNQIATIVAALPTATQAAIVDNQTTKLLQEV